MFCPLGFPTEGDLVVDLADEGLKGDNLQTSVFCVLEVRRIAVNVFPVNDLPRTSNRSSPSCIHMGIPYCTVIRLSVELPVVYLTIM